MALEAVRSDGGDPVDDDAARAAWERAARPVLVQVARRYGALITPKDFAEEVQAISGVRTRAPESEWVGDVLDAVGRECGARQEPLLSAFCVGADGRIGARYAEVVRDLGGPAPVDIEMHAATQRVEAHRYHGATLPVDGGKPALPPQLAAERAAVRRAPAPRARAPRTKAPATPRKAKKPERPRVVCPTCFLELPATGRCDNCDD